MKIVGIRWSTVYGPFAIEKTVSVTQNSPWQPTGEQQHNKDRLQQDASPVREDHEAGPFDPKQNKQGIGVSASFVMIQRGLTISWRERVNITDTKNMAARQLAICRVNWHLAKI